MSDVNTLIKKPISTVFRRVEMKRRSASTGLFESDWQNISKDIKSYGRISTSIDSARRSKFTFGNAKLVMDNSKGRYNPHNDQGSLWYGYLNQQRTLVRYKLGFVDIQKNSSGIYVRSEFPSEILWDESFWDGGSTLWDQTISSTIFTGLISGDIILSDSNDVVFNIKPLTSIFQDFPAKNLTGWTTTGLTASQFVNMVRDQTDGSGSYVFRPFFGDTTTFWDISTTSNVYASLNTGSSADVIDKSVWEIIEKLSEAENFVPYVSRNGSFRFISRDSVTTSTSFQFYGSGVFNTEYGHTIKRINSYGFKISNYYSRVSLKFKAESTSSSYQIVENTLSVSATSNPWVFGQRTLDITNTFIQTSTVASTLATLIHSDVSALKNEIDFETTLIPHLNLFDRITINHNPNSAAPNTLWDLNDWAADNTTTSRDLIFDKANFDALVLSGQEFKFLSCEIDLDNMSNKFVAREV